MMKKSKRINIKQSHVKNHLMMTAERMQDDDICMFDDHIRDPIRSSTLMKTDSKHAVSMEDIGHNNAEIFETNDSQDYL